MKALLWTVLLIAGLVVSTEAHAFIDHAEPAVGAKVSASPGEVRIWFTEKLEAAFSTIKVLDADGKQVDKGDLKADAANAAILRVTLPPLRPGLYRVTWRATSVDTHVTKGEFTFQVQGS